MRERKRVSVDPSRLKLLNEEGTEGTLLGTRCLQCEEYFFGQVEYCQNCTSTDLDSTDLGRDGVLFSYTIVRVPPAGWQGTTPYALGQVELPQGPHVLSEVLECPFLQLQTGMKLQLTLAVGGEDGEGNQVLVYKWRPPRSR